MVNARLGDWTELCGSRNVFSSQMLSLVDICTDSGMSLPRGQINRDCRRATLRTRKHSMSTSSIALDEGRDIGEGTGTPLKSEARRGLQGHPKNPQSSDYFDARWRKPSRQKSKKVSPDAFGRSPEELSTSSSLPGREPQVSLPPRLSPSREPQRPPAHKVPARSRAWRCIFLHSLQRQPSRHACCRWT